MPRRVGRREHTERTGKTSGTTPGASDAPSAEQPQPRPDVASATAHLTPAAAFDALYTRHAHDLTRQAIVLTGQPHLSQEAVERSFQAAWQRWPEVAVDPDPAGRLRAMVHEYALSPWHRMRPGLRAGQRPSPRVPAAPPAAPPQRALRDALLSLPATYRRALLLHDGLGLDLSETAAEVEASTPATAGRLLHARRAVAERVPAFGLAAATPVRQREILRERLAGLAALYPVAPPAAAAVRTGGERTAGRMTQGAFGLTAVIAAATAFTLVNATTGPLPGRPEAGPRPSPRPPHLARRPRAPVRSRRNTPAPGSRPRPANRSGGRWSGPASSLRRRGNRGQGGERRRGRITGTGRAGGRRPVSASGTEAGGSPVQEAGSQARTKGRDQARTKGRDQARTKARARTPARGTGPRPTRGAISRRGSRAPGARSPTGSCRP
ncbi:sigma factor-like helix-turn-helix DNA-binding protein [Streptomyces sp. Ac-502]|uniref:sigma factor-like helix-turn-helix DNA-binding protein n=1 Tax=Streptomyces sp. Ac-502 TaxID=3342801 RepID=UPI0038629847